MNVTSAQLRAARAMLEWTSDYLAQRARVHRRTVRKLERGEATPQRKTIARIVAAIELAGAEFVDGGVRMRCHDGVSWPYKSAEAEFLQAAFAREEGSSGGDWGDHRRAGARRGPPA